MHALLVLRQANLEMQNPRTERESKEDRRLPIDDFHPAAANDQLTLECHDCFEPQFLTLYYFHWTRPRPPSKRHPYKIFFSLVVPTLQLEQRQFRLVGDIFIMSSTYN